MSHGPLEEIALTIIGEFGGVRAYYGITAAEVEGMGERRAVLRARGRLRWKIRKLGLPLQGQCFIYVGEVPDWRTIELRGE